jgi:hypothetical protein
MANSQKSESANGFRPSESSGIIVEQYSGRPLLFSRLVGTTNNVLIATAKIALP